MICDWDHHRVVKKSDYGLDSKLFPQQPETYCGFEVTAVLQSGTGLDHSAAVAIC